MSSQLAPQKTPPQSRVNSAFKQLWSMHWVMASCYLLLIVGGVLMARMPDGMPFRGNAYTLHKSIGVLTLGLLTLRIFVLQRVWWRKYSRRFPKLTPDWIRTFLFHTAIYIFMLAVPLSGFFLSNSYKSGNVPFFWLTLPDLFPKNSAVVELGRDLHFWLAYTFLGFIILHAIDQQKYLRSLWRRANKVFQKTANSKS